MSEQLVTAHRGLAGMSLTLHHRGRGVLENWNGDTTTWTRRTNRGNDRGGDTYINVGSHAQVGAVVGRDNTGTLTASLTLNNGPNPQDIQAWLGSVQALLPTVKVEAGQLARIEEAIEQLQTELAQPAPREGLLRRFGQAVLDELAKGAAALALPQLGPVLRGMIEAGQALFQ